MKIFFSFHKILSAVTITFFAKCIQLFKYWLNCLEKISTIEERNTALLSQVNELISEKCKRDAHLDDLIDALEERVAKWQVD